MKAYVRLTGTWLSSLKDIIINEFFYESLENSEIRGYSGIVTSNRGSDYIVKNNLTQETLELDCNTAKKLFLNNDYLETLKRNDILTTADLWNKTRHHDDIFIDILKIPEMYRCTVSYGYIPEYDRYGSFYNKKVYTIEVADSIFTMLILYKLYAN